MRFYPGAEENNFMNVYMSDKDQVQMIKDWWKKYGTTILTAIVVFLAANFSVQYWHKYTAQKKEQASILYTQMINAYAENKPSEFKLFAQNLMQNYESSSYASFAAMMLAKEAVGNNKLDEALSDLQWVKKNAKSSTLRQLAETRAARILLAENKPVQALETLHNGNQKQAFAPIVNEVKGDALLLQNNEKEAAKAYAAAMNNPATKETSSPLLQMKAEQLGTDDIDSSNNK
jgi:predicted negative regulator of RcsB-dependent stress response